MRLVLNLGFIGELQFFTIVGTVLIKLIYASLIFQTDDLDHGRPLNVLLVGR